MESTPFSGISQPVITGSDFDGGSPINVGNSLPILQNQTKEERERKGGTIGGIGKGEEIEWRKLTILMLKRVHFLISDQTHLK